MEGLKKTTKYLSYYSQSSGRNSKPKSPKCEAEVPTTQPAHSRTLHKYGYYQITLLSVQ